MGVPGMKRARHNSIIVHPSTSPYLNISKRTETCQPEHKTTTSSSHVPSLSEFERCLASARQCRAASRETMADSGSNRATDNKSPLKSKVVRAQKILPAAASSSREQLDPPDESDESTDHASTSLPRSHTPGHLASKSSAAHDHRRRAPPIDQVTPRHRSQSASYAQSRHQTSSANAGASNYPDASNGAANDREDAIGDRLASYGRKPLPKRTASAIASQQPSVSGAGPNRSASGDSRQVRPQYIPYPPLQDPKDALDVPSAPSSGMYWSQALVSGTPTPPLRAHTTTLIGSNVYVFGGCDSKACFNDLYVLDADAFYWSHPYVVGEVPVPLRAMTCTAVGKKLIVFGGGDGPTYFNDVYVLDTANFRWSKPRILGDKTPSKRRAHTTCLYKNGLYVFGGGDGVRALNDIWRLDVSDVNKMSWRLISAPEKKNSSGQGPRPKARGYHTANMVGSKLIIYGGSDGGECFDDVWVYDVEEHFWKTVTIPVTFRRLSHTATIVGPYLFIIGGHDGNEYSNDLLLLNLVTMTWDRRKTYGKPPSGRGYHGAILYDSRLVVIGGFDGSEVFRDVMLLELAVHAYYSQISHFTIEV